MASSSGPRGIGIVDRRRVVGEDLAHAALQGAHRLATRRDDEPAGDRPGVVQAADVVDRPQPGRLHDVVDVGGGEPVAPGDAPQDAVEAADQLGPGVLVARGGASRQA